VHIDLDNLDPSEGIANPYAAQDGLSRADLSEALAAIAALLVPVAAAAVTAYDPALESDRRMAKTAVSVVTELIDRFA
jgi:arginase